MKTILLGLIVLMAVGCNGTAEPSAENAQPESREMAKFKTNVEAVIDKSRFILKRAGDNISVDESMEISEDIHKLVAAVYVPTAIKGNEIDGKPISESLESLENAVVFVSGMEAMKFRDGQYDTGDEKLNKKVETKVIESRAEIDRIIKGLTERYLD